MAEMRDQLERPRGTEEPATTHQWQRSTFPQFPVSFNKKRNGEEKPLNRSEVAGYGHIRHFAFQRLIATPLPFSPTRDRGRLRG